jgi:hypothetical protein
MNDNLCEEIRQYLKKEATFSGTEVTTKQLGMLMGLLKPNQVGANSDNRMETIIGDELRRLRHKKCKGRKRTNDTSKHAHMAYEHGFEVKVASYKSENSQGGRRPAILWKIKKIQKSLENFMIEQPMSETIVEKCPISKSLVLEAMHSLTIDEVYEVLGEKLKEIAA